MKGEHYHFKTKKEMEVAISNNFNIHDTFSYGQLLPVPTGIYRNFLNKYAENIENLVFNRLMEYKKLEQDKWSTPQ